MLLEGALASRREHELHRSLAALHEQPARGARPARPVAESLPLQLEACDVATTHRLRPVARSRSRVGSSSTLVPRRPLDGGARALCRTLRQSLNTALSSRDLIDVVLITCERGDRRGAARSRSSTGSRGSWTRMTARTFAGYDMGLAAVLPRRGDLDGRNAGRGRRSAPARKRARHRPTRSVKAVAWRHSRPPSPAATSGGSTSSSP